jgi:hypothetical protein
MKIATLFLLGQLFMVQLAAAQHITFAELSTMQKPASTKFSSYLSKNGTRYEVGGKVKYGIPRGGQFTFIWSGDGILTDVTPAPTSLANVETEIIGIVLDGSKKAGYRVYFRTRPEGVLTNYKIDIENALEVGEVKSSVMTSDEALAELKKAKEKFDLGLIDKKKYDSTKTALAKYIK